MNKQELELFLKHHDDLYYNQDAPELSDAEYDAFKSEYVEKYGEYNYVPGEAKKDSKKFEHLHPVLSLDKTQISETEEIRKRLDKLWPVVIEPKFDGLTIVSYPDMDNQGSVHVTRGNGKIGEVVTENVNKVEGLGHMSEAVFPIRSEAILLKSAFEEINRKRIEKGLKPFENLRNGVAGSIRNEKNFDPHGIKLFAYEIIGANAIEEQSLDVLKNEWGWNTTDYYIPTSIEDALDYINNFDRESLDYDIDGLVVKHNGAKDFGMTGHHPNNAFAIKFDAEGEWTTIKDIVWQVGRTGKITPVANFEGVKILGSTVNRATLHNYGIMKALGLNTIMYRGKYTPATRVFVIKANDVIPAIVKVEQPEIGERNIYESRIFEPDKCPVCGGKVQKETDQLFCINPSCSAKILNRLTHLSQRDAFNIEELGDETARKMIDKYKEILKKTLHQMDMAIEAGEDDEEFEKAYLEIDNKLEHLHPSFIYDLTLDDLRSLPGFAEKSANTLYKNIRNSMNISFDKFLYGAGIPLIGEKASRDIAEAYYNTIESEVDAFASDYLNGFEKLKEVKGIGPEMIKSLKENFESMLIPFGEYSEFNITDVVPKKKANNQLTFVITGEFEIPRKEIKAMIEEAGHKVSGSVSKNTSYLLAAPGEEGTTKYKKAKEVGTTIINSLFELQEVLKC